MSMTCPTCGQPAPNRQGDEAALLKLLRDDHKRYVYRIAGSAEWAVTRMSGVHFSGEMVRRLAGRGLLAPVFPGTGAERESYGDATYYGRPSYVAEIAEKIERRDQRTLAVKPEKG